MSEPSITDTDGSISFIGAARVERAAPIAYRLMKKRDGTLVLQGCYYWTLGPAIGFEWRDIPTEIEE